MKLHDARLSAQLGQAPTSVERVDIPRVPNEKTHLHIRGGDALNWDGTWKHGGRDLTRAEAAFAEDSGWILPDE